MSERRRDGAWIQAVAASRGIVLEDERAEQVARDSAPVLERFDTLVAGLRVDDEPDELRRALAAAAGG